MVAGVSGTLLSSGLLDAMLDTRDASLTTAATRAPALVAWWRRVQARLGPASSARAIADLGALPLVERLGYDVLRFEPLTDGFIGTLGHAGHAVAVVRTTLWDAPPGPAWRAAVRAGRHVGAEWALVYTGTRLRLLHAARAWSRRSLDIDLARALGDARGATALPWLCEAAALASGPSPSRLTTLVAQADAYGINVCASLGAGVLQALDELVGAFAEAGVHRQRPDGALLDEALVVVYRVLFLLFAEARAMVPTWHPIYRDAYTIDVLRRRALDDESAPGLWEALQAIAKLAHAGCQAGDLVVTAFNGRLFSPRHAPAATRLAIPNRVAGRTILSLATTVEPGGARAPVCFADLDVEQLGVVYERVLDYKPERGSSRVELRRTSLARKSTGSFYTPRAMTEFLVRRTLHPLVDGRSADQILALRVLDPAMGSGAFLVAATRYLTSAVEHAERRDGEWPASTAAATDRRATIARLIAQRCIYGVDVNPMAVQLARLSLWLTTLARDRPLTFLDHHLASGDSLIGAWLRDVVSRPPGRAQSTWRASATLPLFATDPVEALATAVLPARWRLEEEPGDTAAAVHAKERALDALRTGGSVLAQWKTAADLWCAAWSWAREPLADGLYRDIVAGLTGGSAALSERQTRELRDRAAAEADRRRFFHWEIEFPEVFLGAHGRRGVDAGFDAVIGNPPWDVLRADTGDDEARATVRNATVRDHTFLRASGIYRWQQRGHSNRYQLFLERSMHLLRAGGRLGMILPSGLLTDQGSGTLRRALLDETEVDRIIGFDNRKAVFPIHRDVRFLLLTATKGVTTRQVNGSFGWETALDLEALPDHVRDDPASARTIALSRSLIECWDPQAQTIPWVTHPMDVALLAQARAVAAPLGSADGWGVRFGRELNATDDKAHFVEKRATAPRSTAWLPIVEGKHIEPFAVRLATVRQQISRRKASTLIDPSTSFDRARLAYRDVASATNRQTVIAAILPPGSLSTHTLFCLKTPLALEEQHVLLALFNSLTVNYLVRLQVTTHVTVATMSRMPVPRPAAGSAQARELIALARRLQVRGDDTDACVQLNSIVANLYGLDGAHYEHLVQTFPLWDEALRRRCIQHYKEGSRGGGE